MANCTAPLPYIFNMTQIEEIGSKMPKMGWERNGQMQRGGGKNGAQKNKPNGKKVFKKSKRAADEDKKPRKGSARNGGGRGNNGRRGGAEKLERHGKGGKRCAFSYLKNPCVINKYMGDNQLYLTTGIIDIAKFETQIFLNVTDPEWRTVINKALLKCNGTVYGRDVSQDPKPPGNGGPMKCDIADSFLTICLMQEMIINSPYPLRDTNNATQVSICDSILQGVTACKFNSMPPLPPFGRNNGQRRGPKRGGN